MQHNSANFPSRRTFITGSALGLTALALAGCDRTQSPTPTPTTAPTPTFTSPAGAGTTLEARLVPGEKLHPKKAYRRLAAAKGQALVVREELCKGNPNRASTRKALAAFGHITDTHILDPTSPAHTTLTFLKNPPSLAKKKTNYFRPQDSLTVQVMDAMVRKLNAVKQGPLSGRPFDFYVSTGDSSDNRGTNEVHAFIDVMNGAKTSAFAFPGKYTGLQAPIELPSDFARFVWQPVQPKKKTESAVWQDKYGFPVAEHLLERASRPVATEGARVPWFSGFGNHDQLAHGGLSELETPSDNFYSALATSDKLIMGIPKGNKYPDFEKQLNSSTQPQAKELIESMPGHTVAASAERRPMTKTEFMGAHWVNPGPHGPAGHGFTLENVRTGTAYYRFQLAEGIIGLMLDTTDPTGGGKGSIGSVQAAWLERELATVNSVSYSSTGKPIRQDAEDQMVVLFSHHPSPSFGALRIPARDEAAINSPEAVLALIGRYPNVILWLNGHQHFNSVWPRKSALGGHAFWEVNTASHTDFPQQSRTVEIINNKDGTLSIAAVMVDHSGPMKLDYAKAFTPAQLAAFSAELALNWPGLNVAARTATTKSQNVELLLKKPF